MEENELRRGAAKEMRGKEEDEGMRGKAKRTSIYRLN